MTDDQLGGIDHLGLLQIGATGVVGGRIIHYMPCIMLHYALLILQCIAFYILIVPELLNLPHPGSRDHENGERMRK